MKTFNGTRPRVDIEKNLKAYGFEENASLYDGGSDFIDFYNGTIKGELIFLVMVDPAFGRFIVSNVKGKVIASEYSENLDDKPWYCALLDAIYKPLEAAL